MYYLLEEMALTFLYLLMMAAALSNSIPGWKNNDSADQGMPEFGGAILNTALCVAGDCIISLCMATRREA